jgi:biotin transport system ATP-binding protein
LISLNNVFYQYEPEGIKALQGISLEINDGEHLAVIGPNGCGKTTLIQHLDALLIPTSGSVTIDGLDTANPTEQVEIRSLVGMVFQNPENQIIGMTVEEDVAFGPENLRLPTSEIKERVAQALELVGITELAQRNIEHLSGGEKRLVAIAGVLAMRPRYIAFDEPTAFLDPTAGARILKIIDQLYGENIGVVHITHNMAEAAMAGRIAVLHNGRVVLDGTPPEVYTRIDLLKEIGMQLPQVTELMINLKQIGFRVRTDIVHMDDAVEQIKSMTLAENKRREV